MNTHAFFISHETSKKPEYSYFFWVLFWSHLSAFCWGKWSYYMLLHAKRPGSTVAIHSHLQDTRESICMGMNNMSSCELLNLVEIDETFEWQTTGQFRRPHTSTLVLRVLWQRLHCCTVWSGNPLALCVLCGNVHKIRRWWWRKPITTGVSQIPESCMFVAFIQWANYVKGGDHLVRIHFGLDYISVHCELQLMRRWIRHGFWSFSAPKYRLLGKAKMGIDIGFKRGYYARYCTFFYRHN